MGEIWLMRFNKPRDVVGSDTGCAVILTWHESVS